MLFFLTGEVQIGKTRWLMDALTQLAERGVEPCGVIAPGQWIPRDGGFEKLGIDNMLLPDHIVQGGRPDLICKWFIHDFSHSKTDPLSYSSSYLRKFLQQDSFCWVMLPISYSAFSTSA